MAVNKKLREGEKTDFLSDGVLAAYQRIQFNINRAKSRGWLQTKIKNGFARLAEKIAHKQEQTK